MSTDHEEVLRALLEGTGPAAGGQPSLAPGCQLEEKTESEEVFEADQPVRHRHRRCGRITGCDDPSQNTDLLCGEWSQPE